MRVTSRPAPAKIAPETREMNRPAQNQRRSDRRPTRLPAVLAFPWGELDGTIENIAEGGAFFVTGTLEGAAEVGDRLTVAF